MDRDDDLAFHHRSGDVIGTRQGQGNTALTYCGDHRSSRTALPAFGRHDAT